MFNLITHLNVDKAAEIWMGSLLRGRRYLIVMASYVGKLPIYQKMQALGVKMVVMDGPGHWAKDYVQTGLFEDFIEIDPQNIDVALALPLIEAYPASFDAVITFEDYASRLTAGIAQALGCVGHPEEAVSLNKFEVRQKCLLAGLPSPRFALIQHTNDLKEAAIKVGFPAVLKPVQGASSCDVFHVAYFDDLATRHQMILQERQRKSDASAFNSSISDESRLAWQKGFTMVLEEYIDGDEYDIDCLLSCGEMVYASVTEEKPQPMMIETGARLPAVCSAQREGELIEMARRVLKLLGYTNGVFHVEAKYTSHGPRLIEVNPRMGGGPIYQMNKLVWGVDLVEQYLLTALNIPIQPVKPAPRTYLSSQILVAGYTGLIIRDDFLDHLHDHPDVVFCETYVRAGEHVEGPESHVPGWLGEIIVRGATREIADQRLASILEQLVIPMEPLLLAAVS